MAVTLDLKKWIPAWLGLGGSAAGRRLFGIQIEGASATPASSTPVTDDTALQLSAVWACTKIISETVAGMPINFYVKNPDGTRTLDPDFHLARLLNRIPNRWQTGVEFKNTTTMSQSMQGNSYALKQFGAGGKLIGLVPLMASQMQVKLLDDGAKVFIYTDGRTTTVYAEQNIWHMMMMPSNAIIGLSPLRYGARAIGIGISAEDRVGVLARNGFKPTGILMIDKTLTPEQRTQIRAQFSDLQEGQGDPLKVLEAGLTYQQITMSPKDVQLLESRRFQIEDIARFWGVPSVLINDTEAGTVWGSGIEQIIQGFYKFTIRPYLERFEASIEKNLLTPAERAKIEVEFDFAALLRGDESTRIENAAKEVSGGLKSINEARRALDGSEPVEGGDKIYLQQQMTPIEELKNDASKITISSST